MRFEADVSQVRPALVEDVGTWPLFPATGSREAVDIVGSKSLNRFITLGDRLLPVVRAALDLFDGEHTLAEIETHLREIHGLRVDVVELHKLLSKSGLLRGSEFQAQISDVDRMTLCLLDFPVGRIREKSYRLLKAFAAILFPLTLVVALTFLFGVLSGLDHGAPETTRGVGIGLLWIVLLIVEVGLHESAHALAAAYFGITVLRFRISLYLGFIPFFYLQLRGLYTVSPMRRVIVWMAGIYGNLVLGCGLLMLTWYDWTSAGFASILRNAAMLSFFLAVANLVPFLPTDGYYILSTILRKHNVRSQAWVLLGSLIRRRRVGKISLFPLAYLITSIGAMVVLLVVQIRMILQSPQARRLPVAFLVGLLVILAFATNWYHRRGVIRSRLLVFGVNWAALGSMLYISGLLPSMKTVLRPFS